MVEPRSYSVLQTDGKLQMDFPTGFSNVNPHPIYEKVMQDIPSFVPAMVQAEKATLPENKRHSPEQLVGMAMGHIRRAAGLWHVHRKFYERSLWAYQESGALDVRNARIGEVGLNQGLHLFVASLVPAEVEGVDIDPATVGFANELFRREGKNGFTAHQGDTDFVFANELPMLKAAIVTQYAKAEGILNLGRQTRFLSSCDLDHTESPVRTKFLTAKGELKTGVVIPFASVRSPHYETGLAHRITGLGEELFPGLTMYSGELVYDRKMYSRKNGFALKHRPGNEYQTKFVLVNEGGEFSILPWCIEPLDMSNEALRRRIAGVTLLTRAAFNLQGFDSHENLFLGDLVRDEEGLRAVISYSAGGENGASNRTVSGLFQVFRGVINSLFEAGRLGNLVGQERPFETIEDLNYLIDHPEVWITAGRMHAPLETEFDIFTDPTDPAFELLANY